MAIDEYTGVGSVSMEKENEGSDGFGMWVKLKIPKEEKEEEGDENTKRVCHICHKTFSSGKALGGHMRIHVQLPNKKYHGGALNSKQFEFMKPTCFMCGKGFKSMKSLSGHMRSHPGRDWRGIRPPPSMPAFNTCSSASLSDPPNSGEKDLTQLLPRAWPVTAKRGRKATAVVSASSFEDDQIWKAVNYLLMMKKKKYDNVVELNQLSESIMKKKKKNDVVVELKLVSESKINNGAARDVVHGETIVNSLSDDDEQRDDRKKMEEVNATDVEGKVMVKNKKKRKKMKELCDLQSSKITSATPMPGSGHNNISPSEALESDEGRRCQKVLRIDLNEAPQSEEEEEAVRIESC